MRSYNNNFDLRFDSLERHRNKFLAGVFLVLAMFAWQLHIIDKRQPQKAGTGLAAEFVYPKNITQIELNMADNASFSFGKNQINWHPLANTEFNNATYKVMIDGLVYADGLKAAMGSIEVVGAEFTPGSHQYYLEARNADGRAVLSPRKTFNVPVSAKAVDAVPCIEKQFQAAGLDVSKPCRQQTINDLLILRAENGNDEGTAALTISKVEEVGGRYIVKVPKRVAFKDLLKVGQEGQEIIQLQERLKQLGYFSDFYQPTGIFDQSTLEATKEFQYGHGIYPAGVIGPKTVAALNGKSYIVFTN